MAEHMPGDIMAEVIKIYFGFLPPEPDPNEAPSSTTCPQCECGAAAVGDDEPCARWCPKKKWVEAQ